MKPPSSTYAFYLVHYLAPMVEIRSEFERVLGVKSLGHSPFAWYIFRQNAVWVTSENGEGRAEKPRHDVPHGVGVKHQHEAELTDQRHGSGSQSLGVFCCIARRRGMVCGIPLSVVCPTFHVLCFFFSRVNVFSLDR